MRNIYVFKLTPNINALLDIQLPDETSLENHFMRVLSNHGSMQIVIQYGEKVHGMTVEAYIQLSRDSLDCISDLRICLKFNFLKDKTDF